MKQIPIPKFWPDDTCMIYHKGGLKKEIVARVRILFDSRDENRIQYQLKRGSFFLDIWYDESEIYKSKEELIASL